MGQQLVGAEQLIGAAVNAAIARITPAFNQLQARLGQLEITPRGPNYGTADKPAGDAYRLILQFPIVTLAAGASTVITQQPMGAFRPSRIILPRDVAGSLLVTDVKIGRKSQFFGTSAGAAPGFMFADDAVQEEFQWETCQSTIPIDVAFTNTSLAAVTFAFAMTGPALDS